MTDVAPVLGVLAAFADTLPYIRDTLPRRHPPAPRHLADLERAHDRGVALSGAFATGAVGSVDPALLLYPVYFALVNGAIALLIHHPSCPLARADYRV